MEVIGRGIKKVIEVQRVVQDFVEGERSTLLLVYMVNVNLEVEAYLVTFTLPAGD